ncbi:Hypothetical_protein [Hexamita inflata]|uniref:Hypothetical_protein n=1 Tax=Hexamita inflata TaxID=28002 RepID=A0AA86RBJ3_9EUKA|nr:Hypothetical protein HINF_LOCUS59263 [Hexamita inflata]
MTRLTVTLSSVLRLVYTFLTLQKQLFLKNRQYYTEIRQITQKVNRLLKSDIRHLLESGAFLDHPKLIFNPQIIFTPLISFPLFQILCTMKSNAWTIFPFSLSPTIILFECLKLK